MPFLNNNKFKEIRNEANNGNEKALKVLQALRQGNQEDLDRLVQEYYAIAIKSPILENKTIEKPVLEKEPMVIENKEIENEDKEIEKAERIEENEKIEEIEEKLDQVQEQEPQQDNVEVEDLTDVLDKETEGLFDENEIEAMDFAKYLGNKRRDLARINKTSDYFKAFNPGSRANYIASKKEAYKNKFGDAFHDINSLYNDYDKSIDAYTQSVNDMLDDEQEMNVSVMGNAYNEIIDNNGIMHCFGRYWDEEDTQHIVEDLKPLVEKYGKKNVIAALNVLKTDNNNFRDYKVGQINEEIERYNKFLDKILK